MGSKGAFCGGALGLAVASACASGPSLPAPSGGGSTEWQLDAVTESVTGLWTAGNDVYAVGYSPSGGSVAHWDGQAWRRMEKPNAQFVISGTGRRDVWVGGRGAVLHYTGASWSMPYRLAAGPAGVTEDVRSLAALAGEIWFGGELARAEDQEGRVVTGNLFHVVEGVVEAVDCCGTTARIDGIWPTGGKEIWVLDHGQPARFDGNMWTRPLRAKRGASIQKVWGTSPRDVWFVGDDFVVEHWDGERLTPAALPMTTEGAFHDVSGTGTDDVWAVGTSGVVVHYDGARWTVLAIPTTATLRAVHVGTRVWVAGDQVIASLQLPDPRRTTPQ